MSNSAYDGLNDKNFFENIKALFVNQSPNLSQNLNIAVIGKVSSGKSSLINALLQLSRIQALEVAKVGAISGVTKKLNILKLDTKVHLIDSPGLDDIRQENSKITEKFLQQIDIGIFVVTGSSDASQKKNLDDLKRHCDSIFVVLNKIDEWDDLGKEGLNDVIEQWQNDLGEQKIYPTSTRGYDPKSRVSKMDIRGVAQLRSDIQSCLEEKRKDLLLARHMADKQSHAAKIISTALTFVATQVFLPGSAAYIAATQAAAITSLHYLYTGKTISLQQAATILPILVAESARSSLFLTIQSFLPPTGLIDGAAALVAVSVTLALLATVNYVLSIGAGFEQEEQLREKFRTYHEKANKTLKDLALTDIRDVPGKQKSIITKFLKGQ